jgi:hypothetical protein
MESGRRVDCQVLRRLTRDASGEVRHRLLETIRLFARLNNCREANAARDRHLDHSLGAAGAETLAQWNDLDQRGKWVCRRVVPALEGVGHTLGGWVPRSATRRLHLAREQSRLPRLAISNSELALSEQAQARIHHLRVEPESDRGGLQKSFKKTQ